MACLYVAGIPIFEDAKCADARRNDRSDRNDSDNERRMANNASDNERKMANTYFRNYGTGTTPAEGIVSSIASPLFTAGQNIACTMMGIDCGSQSSPSSSFDPTPILYGGAALVGVVVLYNLYNGRK